ncbi:MAG: DsbA family protein [Pseudomonadota bacterium]
MTSFLFRLPRAALLTAALAALPLAALPVTALGQAAEEMSDAEREAFRAEIRAYLLENPEVLMEALEVLEAREAAAQAEMDDLMVQANAEALFESPHAWEGGNPEGDITLVEFIDYRCGFCRRAFPEVQELVESDGNIRIVVKEFPILGEQSVLASRFAIATKMIAGDAAYKDVHDALITMRGDMNPLALELVAVDLGLDADAIVAKMEDEEVTDVIRANHALAQALQIQGTPTYVLGGQLVRGYVPLDGLREMVEAERTEG